MTIMFEEECAFEFPFSYQEVANLVIEAALDFEKCPYETEISLTITNDEEIRKINQEFRKIDKATDVLSFPMVKYEQPGEFAFLEEADDCFHPESGELLLGDIVLSFEKVKEQAKSYEHSQEREFAFLVVHSMLHLMGYDHMEETEGTIMEEKQDAILASLNINR